MTKEELIWFNELADITIEAEIRLNQLRHELKNGNIPTARTHIERAFRICSRLKDELGDFRIK
jgi:hypothetical protein